MRTVSPPSEAPQLHTGKTKEEIERTTMMREIA
jgi:hypothetical protein